MIICKYLILIILSLFELFDLFDLFDLFELPITEASSMWFKCFFHLNQM